MTTTRELYKKKYEAQLHEWSAKVDGLKAKAEKLGAQAKLDVKPHLDGVHAQFAAAGKKLDELVAATDDKWDHLVTDVEARWTDLKAAAEGAHAAVLHHETQATKAADHV